MVVQVIGLNGQFGCGSESFARDSGTYSLTRSSLTLTRTVLTDTAVTQNTYSTIGPIELLLAKGCSYNSCALPNGLVLCGRTEAANEPLAYLDEDGCSDSTTMAISTATELFRMAKDSLLGSFEEAYQQKCLNAAALEQFTLSHPVSEYHYTLYYYDLAGNLVKTISPEGVKPNRDSSWLAQVAQKRQNGEIQVPTHSLATVYRYNTLNQVVTQNSPDGGYSKFWYDRLGRLSVSQNAKQLLETKYSYTKYDVLGRITEVGQKPQTVAMTQVISRNPGQLTDWLNQTYTNTNGDRTMSEQVTATMYDLVDITTTDLPLVIPVNQKSYTLRNRVSYTRTYDFLLALEDNTPRYSLYDFSSTYSYDIHGNVDTLLQQYRTGLLGAHGDNRFKVIAYKYDLVSGKVNQVHYQPGQRDQLYHRYVYDAENRLTDVYVTDSKATINDRDLEEHDAHYEYYKHGPLARTVLGNQQVQGLDYAYTLQGWLKGVNSTGLTTTLDMGNDSKADDRHPLVARDVFGFNLNYFTGDYAAISGKNVFPGHTGIISPSTAYRALYNGNISSMAVNIGKFNQPQLYNYQYDQLNRLVAMDVFRGYVTGSNSWSAITQVNDYKERISYDGNGNILSYLRNGTTADSGPITMDSMSYKYFTNTDGTYRNNRLRLVRDSVATGNYSVDIDDQLPRVSNAADSNYVYDAIGNLIQDKSENITNIQWSVYGKIQKITKTAVNTGDVSAISYWYDAAGNRVGKKVEALNRKPQYSWYTRDASGNVMGVYQYEGNTLTDDTLRLREHHLYGSSRIGVWNRWINMDLPVSTGTTINLLGKSYDGTFERGNKFFELSNHLGNVLATVSDKKFGHNGGSGVVDYYDADVVTASDYYPFGMLMPGRQFGQGENFPGVLVNGTTTVNGYSLPIDLNLTSRGAGDAAEYVASNSVEFDGEFESSSTDEFSAYIADNTYAGKGNQVSGGGAYGTAGRYRYGFNGQEMSNEIKGVGNSYTAEFWEYDPRIGRRWNLDPKPIVGISDYSVLNNSPIEYDDPDGDCATCPKNAKTGSTVTEKDAGGATPLGGFVYAGKDASLTYTNIGTEENSQWVISSFQNKSGDVYSWNNDKKWYANAKGSEYDQSGWFDIYDWASKGYGKPLSEAAKNALEGQAFKDMRAGYNQYKDGGGGLGVAGFVGMGIKKSLSEWGSDLTAGGHRSGQAFIGAWQFTAEVSLNAGLKSTKSFDLLSFRNGNGPLGSNGLRISNYRIDMLYRNPSSGLGHGTLFSIKQMKQGGNLLRWDYGTLHSGGVGWHSTFRVTIQNVQYGSSAQRSWAAPFMFFKYKKP